MARGKSEVVATGTGEVVAAEDAWQLGDAKGVDFVPKTFEEIEAYFANEGGILTFEGSAYAVIEKDRLIDVPFMIVDVRVWESAKYGREACSVMLLTKNPLTINGEDRTHFVINDGSTGIFEQVKQMVNKSGRKSGILCPNGLRKSTYKVMVKDEFEGTEEEIEASTFYVG